MMATKGPQITAYEPKAVLVSNYSLSNDVPGSSAMLFECQR
jgi:hypothetical protein